VESTLGAKRRYFLSCFSTFLALQIQLVVLVCDFAMISTVCSVSCFLFFYFRCPLCPVICKSGITCPGPCLIESASLLSDSFTPKNIIGPKTAIQSECTVSQGLFISVCVQTYAQSDTVNSVLYTINQSRHTVWGARASMTRRLCLHGAAE